MRWTLDQVAGRRTLLVASTGGHLEQLVRLHPRLDVAQDSPWVTFDTPQSRSLLAGRDVHFVPYVAPRDWRGIAAAARIVRPLLRQVDAAVSTGAGVALAALPQSLLSGKPSVYIESISRVRGPSMSGRVLERLPKLGLYTQHKMWDDRRGWRHGPSVLESYTTSISPGVRKRPRRLLVALGTIEPYRFDRLINLVLAYVRRHPDVEVLWQLGASDRDDLPGRVVEQLSTDDFEEALQWADLVISHSGVGVSLSTLDAGRVPVLLARRAELDEHVDDHQEQILKHLSALGLAADAEATLTDQHRVIDVTQLDVTATS